MQALKLNNKNMFGIGLEGTFKESMKEMSADNVNYLFE